MRARACTIFAPPVSARNAAKKETTRRKGKRRGVRDRYGRRIGRKKNSFEIGNVEKEERGNPDG